MNQWMTRWIIFIVMQLSMNGVGLDHMAYPSGVAQISFNEWSNNEWSKSQVHLASSNTIVLQVYNSSGQEVLSETYRSGVLHGPSNEHYDLVSRRDFSFIQLPQGGYHYVVASLGRVLGKGTIEII